MLSDIERSKYEEVWSLPDYAKHSPGKETAEYFVSICKPKAGDTVADFGCGKGEGGLALAGLGLVPFYIDIVDAGAPNLIQQPLWKLFDRVWDWGYCCDVMEHIPEQFTMLCVSNMANACRNGVFLSISFSPDSFGAFVGQPLHLTVKPFTWWRDSLAEVCEVRDARDRIGEGVFWIA